MMTRKVLITLCENDVAPRFDLTSEVFIATLTDSGAVKRKKTIVLAHSSADELCQLMIAEGIDLLICNGIEQEYFEYLTWKKIEVVDSVMGPWERAFERIRIRELKAGAILFDPPERQ